MKHYFIGFFFLIFFIDLAYGQNWTETHLSNHVSIAFPVTPEITEVGNKKFYQIESVDYIINVVTADMSVNPNFNIEYEELVDLYNGVIKGKLDAATNSRLLNEKQIELNKYEGREIEYTKDFNGISNIKVDSRILLVDKVLYLFELWDMSGKGQNKMKKKFFQSISVR